MIIYIDGPDQILYQWDRGQRVILRGTPDGARVDFALCGSDKAVTKDIYEDSGVLFCDIPDTLLMESGQLHGYIYKEDDERGETFFSFVYQIIPRPKPEDYVEPEEILIWHDLEKRISALEKAGFPALGDEYEGKLLYVVGGALVPLALGPGLAIRNGTLYITGGGGGDVETGITVEADSSGVLRVYSGGVEILPTVDEDGVIVWPGVSVSVDASGTLTFKEELDGNS